MHGKCHLCYIIKKKQQQKKNKKKNKPRTKLKTKQKEQNIYKSEKVDKIYMSFSLTTLLQTDAKQFCSCLKAFNFIHSYDTVPKKINK